MIPRLFRPTARRGITLVELVVAVALGTILIGIVAFIWLQAQKIFSSSIHRLETYQRLRTILDVMERDLANTTPTVDMEFFVDTDPDGAGDEEPNGHYDDGVDTVMQGNGTTYFREPWDVANRDPLAVAGEQEFGLPDFPPTLEGETHPYLHAGALLSPEPYSIGAGYTDNRFYWRDEVYVRSFAMVGGENRPALVHYRLVPTPDGRSSLRRRIWFLDESNQITADTDITTILAHGIADLKVAFFFKENTSQEVGSSSGVARWYHVGNVDNDWGPEATTLRDTDELRGMYCARGGARPGEPISLQHMEQFGEGVNAISFVYKGNARFEDQEAGGVAFRPIADGDLTTLGAGTDAFVEPGFQFPGVRPGDKLYVYDATDDDNAQSPGADREAGEHFPDRLFTVETIYSDAEQDHVSVKFREQVNFYRLEYNWLGRDGGEDGSLEITPTQGHHEAAGPVRHVLRSFNVKYRVGFLPAAFLVRLSCDDQINRQVLSFERVIRLLQQ